MAVFKTVRFANEGSRHTESWSVPLRLKEAPTVAHSDSVTLRQSGSPKVDVAMHNLKWPSSDFEQNVHASAYEGVAPVATPVVAP